MIINWQGFFPAVTTKFTENDELDFETFNLNLKAQFDAGLNGTILGDTLGELNVLSDDEKFELLSQNLKYIEFTEKSWGNNLYSYEN